LLLVVIQKRVSVSKELGQLIQYRD